MQIIQTLHSIEKKPSLNPKEPKYLGQQKADNWILLTKMDILQFIENN